MHYAQYIQTTLLGITSLIALLALLRTKNLARRTQALERFVYPGAKHSLRTLGETK